MTFYSDVTWRHGDLSHRQHYWFIDRLFRLVTKKELKLRITGTFRGKYIGDRLPSQSASNRESVSMSWRRYVLPSGDYAICVNPLFIGIYNEFAVVYDRPICSITPAEVGLCYKIFILSSKHPSLLKHGFGLADGCTTSQSEARYKVFYIDWYIDGSVQDCSISMGNALEIPHSCTKPSVCKSPPHNHCVPLCFVSGKWSQMT